MLQRRGFAINIKVKGKPAGHPQLVLPPKLGFEEAGHPASALSIDEGELQRIAGGKSLAGTHRQLLAPVFDPGRAGISGLAVKPRACHTAVGKEKIVVDRFPGEASQGQQQDKSDDFLLHLRLIMKVNPHVLGLALRPDFGAGSFCAKVNPSGP